jgi:hypothetical protein
MLVLPLGIWAIFFSYQLFSGEIVIPYFGMAIATRDEQPKAYWGWIIFQAACLLNWLFKLWMHGELNFRA